MHWRTISSRGLAAHFLVGELAGAAEARRSGSGAGWAHGAVCRYSRRTCGSRTMIPSNPSSATSGGCCAQGARRRRCRRRRRPVDGTWDGAQAPDVCRRSAHGRSGARTTSRSRRQQRVGRGSPWLLAEPAAWADCMGGGYFGRWIASDGRRVGTSPTAGAATSAAGAWPDHVGTSGVLLPCRGPSSPSLASLVWIRVGEKKRRKLVSPAPAGPEISTVSPALPPPLQPPVMVAVRRSRQRRHRLALAAGQRISWLLRAGLDVSRSIRA